MKKLWILIFLTVFGLNPALVSAYGDTKEHAGMMHHEGSRAMHEEHAATLREAASALQTSRPDLAAKLEAMAKMHEGKEKAEGEAAEGHPHEHEGHTNQ